MRGYSFVLHSTWWRFDSVGLYCGLRSAGCFTGFFTHALPFLNHMAESFLFFLLLLIIFLSKVGSSSISVGIAVQGKADELLAWQRLYENESFATARQNVALFLLSFDKSMDHFPPVTGVFLFFASNTTWSSGRNYLAREMHKFEVKSGHLLRYWLFADADMAALRCKAATRMSSLFPAATPANGENSAAAGFCLARHVQHYLLSRLQYASVFFLGALGEEHETYRFDCGDAQFHAMHRAAVPVLLPYVERLEDLSWQEAQAVLWRVAAGCIAEGGIGAGMLETLPESKRHSSYPGGSYLEARSHVINELYGKLHLSPHPIDNSTFNTVQGDCANQPNQKDELRRRPEEAPGLLLGHNTKRSKAGPASTTAAAGAAAAAGGARRRRLEEQQQLPPPKQPSNEDIERSAAWKSSTVFRHCYHRLSSRFDRFMQGSSLESIDGPRLQKGAWSKVGEK